MKDRAAGLDLEVAELLADEPELLAIADAVAATQRRPRRRRSMARFGGLAVAVLTLGLVLVALPDRGEKTPLLSEALAAVGRGPVLHAQIETVLPATSVVALATGRARRQTIAIEYWFDEPRSQLRTVVRRAGVAVDEFLETRTGATSQRGRVRLATGAEPALDPALAGFVTRYRDVLARGAARVERQGQLDGRRVVWLRLEANGIRERVAVDAETYVPLQIVPLGQQGREGSFSWRVRLIETVARVEADFTAPSPRPPEPFRGDVSETRPLLSDQVIEEIAWPALWLGESWRGLRLVSLDQETLSRGYPPESRVRADRGQGLRLRYAVDGAARYVELSEAPFPEPAYAFMGGELTFNGNPIPLEGQVELVALGSRPGRAIGQLRRDGVYVTIWASSRGLALEAARALTRITKR